jgi:hypothetical protein
VLLQDAVVAVWLQESSCVDAGSSMLGPLLPACMCTAPGASQAFPSNPDAEHAALEEAVVLEVLRGRHDGFQLHTHLLEYDHTSTD